jgi:PadR family transcriptional regulator, regulatory protein PadR
MSDQQDYIQELLYTWEETYKKGQLTFWLLLTLRDKTMYVGEIKEYIEQITMGTVSCEEQSLYRALRKFHKLEIVDFVLKEGNKGPDRKYYFLTPLGRKLLAEFIERNISVFYQSEVRELLSD